MAPRRNAIRRYVYVLHGCTHYDRGSREVHADTVQQAQAIGSRHHDVAQHQIEVCLFAQQCQCLFCARRSCDGVSTSFEQSGDDTAHRCFVVDD